MAELDSCLLFENVAVSLCSLIFLVERTAASNFNVYGLLKGKSLNDGLALLSEVVSENCFDA